jgi:hypothetical protein
MPRFDGDLPECRFGGDRAELDLEVDATSTQVDFQRHLSEISYSSRCVRFSTGTPNDESFRCAGHMPAALDHRPVLLAETYRGRTAVAAIRLGYNGEALPTHQRAMFAVLRALCAEEVKRYASGS